MNDKHEYFEYTALFFENQGVVLSGVRLKKDLEPFHVGDLLDFVYFNVADGHVELIDFGVNVKYKPAKDGTLMRVGDSC